MTLVLKESIFIGILILIIALPVMFVQQILFPGDIASPQKYWISTIIIGVVAHLFAEFSGLNKYYCKYGNACQPKS